jgi:hypothetical protein
MGITYHEDSAPAASPILIMNYDQARLRNEEQKGLEKEEHALPQGIILVDIRLGFPGEDYPGFSTCR